MRLDRKKQRELARSKGLTGRTIVQFSWLAISAVLAYLAIDWLFDSGQLTYRFFYQSLFIPRSVPEPIILAVLVLIVVVIMQFFLVLGYAIASPQGRERTGNPSPYSTNYDPSQDDYRN